MNDFLAQEYLFTIVPTAVLSLALAAVAVSYIFLLIRLGKSEKDKLFLQSKIRGQTSEILKDAQDRRLKIIQQATDKAHEILRDTQVFDSDTRKKLDFDYQEIRKRQEEFIILRSQEISKSYDQFTLSLRKATEDQFAAMARNMEKNALAEIEQFRKEIEDERIFMHKQMSSKIDEEFKKSQKNIEDYKNSQIKKVDKQVYNILQALTRDVLGRSLSIHDHEDLVQKALVQMKMDMNSDLG
jgi:F0F1-type ATP synthase membrane subunit b/b'